MEQNAYIVNELALRIANLEVEKANVKAQLAKAQQEISEKNARIDGLENQGGEK